MRQTGWTVVHRDHSFMRPAEFLAEQWNLLVCCGNEPSRRIYGVLQKLTNFL